MSCVCVCVYVSCRVVLGVLLPGGVVGEVLGGLLAVLVALPLPDLHHLVGALAQRHIEVADQLGACTHTITRP